MYSTLCSQRRNALHFYHNKGPIDLLITDAIDMLAFAREAGGGDEAMSGTKNGQFEIWLPR
jgi:hypothetical protein